MLTFLKRLFDRSPKTPSAVLVQQSPASQRGTGLDVYQGDEDPGDYAITRYPPFDKGIPVIEIDKILHSQQELVDRIFRTAGVSRADFDKLYRPAIINLARHVHLLPATSPTYFRGTGGLFRMSLEIALNSLQSANAAVFPTGGGVERRFFMQPKWTLGTFLAGLCGQNYRTVNMMAVMTRENAQWTPLLSQLYDWCVSQKADVYFVRWMEDNHVHGAQASAAYSISQVVPHEVLQYLASDNNQVVPSMTAAIAGVEMNTSENPIGRLVAPIITRVIEDDLKRSATNYGHLVIGAHLEMHLLDAMRRLVRGGKWIANNVASGGRVWVGQEGVFVDWPVAAGDIANLLARDNFAGIPKDPDTLADLLVSANLLQNNQRGGRYWTIALPGTFEAKDGMVKLRDGNVIFPQGFDFDPYRNVQLTLNAPSPSAASAASSAPQQPSPKPTSQPAPMKEQSSAAPTKPTGNQSGASSAAFHNGNAPGVKNAGEHASAPPPAPKKGLAEPEKKTDQSTRSEQQSTASAPDWQPKKPKKQQPKPQSSAELEGAGEEESENPAPPGIESSVGEGESLGTETGPTAVKLLGSLKKGNAWLLNEVMNAYRNNTLTGVVVALPHGLGISHDELNVHGIPVMELLEELGLKSWLWQDKTRASRRIHPVEIDGKTHRMVILKPDIAIGLGFDMTVKEQ